MLFEHNQSHDLTCQQINIRAGDGCIPVPFSFDKVPDKETKLVIGSDGLWNFVKLDKIKEFIEVYEGESALNLCHKEATTYGAFDDFSMILFTF